jgi:hypothetical protein
MRHLQSKLSDTHILEVVYVPQFTSSACSAASVAIAANFARGLPAEAEAPIVTQSALLEEVGDEAWVLVMDLDREWYVPYWSPDAKLLDALLKPAAAAHGPLAGETGGLVWIKLAGAP